MKTKGLFQNIRIRYVVIALVVSFSLTITNAQLQPDTPLSEADASFIGEAAGDESGWTMPAGDVNGDGFDDILITAWHNDEGGINAGQTYLLLGSDTLTWGMDFDLSQADASFIGEEAGDQAGGTGRTVGDVNGDGFDDFMIGADGNDEGGMGAGQAYLLLGSDTLTWGMDFDLSQADASFIGEAAFDYFGGCIPAGDVNGDTLDDFLIYAPLNDEGGTDAGQCYLFLGRAAADWGMDYSAALADASFLGESSGDELGNSTYENPAGDVNGDDLDDFLIGAYGGDYDGITDRGQVYLILGRAGADWGMDFNLSQADASFLGESSDDRAWKGATTGDVNGDSLDDFLIAAGKNDEGGSNAGQCYLILGRAAADWGMRFNLSQADASFIGEAAGDWLGQVSYAGDVDGDGLVDLLMAASKANGYRGVVYLLRGNGAADWGMDFDISQADASFNGEGFEDYAGFPVASAGDVNGDGRNDILIGAGYNDDGGIDAGKGYLILGDSVVVNSIASRDNVLPSKFILHPVHPNPFNPSAILGYELPHASDVSLVVYDLAGKEIARLVDTNQKPGYHEVQWEARDMLGRGVPSGIYIARLVTPEYSESIKMVLLR